MIVKPSYRRPPFRTAFLAPALLFVVFVTCFDRALADLRAVFRAGFFVDFLGVDFLADLVARRPATVFAVPFRRGGGGATGGSSSGSVTRPSAANGM